MIEDLNSATFHIIDEYQNNNQKLLEILEDINLGNLEELERMSVDLIMNDIDADFTRPVSDLYCLLYTSPSPRDLSTSRMPSSA